MSDLLLALLKGVPITLGVTFGAFVIGSFAAVPLVLMRRSQSPFMHIPARIYIDVIRGIPPIVWLFILFFGFGTIVVLSSIESAVIGMGCVASGYIAEIYRGGFKSLPKGQFDAARALGLSRVDTLRYVVAPQVFWVSIPAITTYLVSLLKDTSIASTIGVSDILLLATQEAQSGSRGFLPFILAAFLYILLSLPIGAMSRIADNKLKANTGSRA